MSDIDHEHAHGMTHDEIWEIARKRAGYALAKIADHQMNTWTKSADTPRDCIASQIAEGMFDALKSRGTSKD